MRFLAALALLWLAGASNVSATAYNQSAISRPTVYEARLLPERAVDVAVGLPMTGSGVGEVAASAMRVVRVGSAHWPPLNSCTPEPASQWAPAGFVCPPEYGIGTASTWPGPGSARNDCTFPWKCEPVSVRSLDTGRVIVVVPTSWCHCWTGVVGPNGETRRIIDLSPELVAQLGLDARLGLWKVEVWPVLPDTAMR